MNKSSKHFKISEYAHSNINTIINKSYKILFGIILCFIEKWADRAKFELVSVQYIYSGTLRPTYIGMACQLNVISPFCGLNRTYIFYNRVLVCFLSKKKLKCLSGKSYNSSFNLNIIVALIITNISIGVIYIYLPNIFELFDFW